MSGGQDPETWICGPEPEPVLPFIVCKDLDTSLCKRCYAATTRFVNDYVVENYRFPSVVLPSSAPIVPPSFSVQVIDGGKAIKIESECRPLLKYIAERLISDVGIAWLQGGYE